MTDIEQVFSRFPVIDPTKLARMAVLETIDTEAIIAARMAKFVTFWQSYDPNNAATYDVGSLEFDPIKILQETSTFFELMLRDRVNQAARSVTLAFGTGTDLDAIASRYPGGVPRLSTEPYTPAGDNAYRRRIWLSPSTLSPNGTYEAYIFWAMTAEAGLHDASAVSTEGTGVVRIYTINDQALSTTWVQSVDGNSWILTPNYNLRPTPDQLANVTAFVIDKSRKSLTDYVKVFPAIPLHASINVHIWLYPGANKMASIGAIQAAINALLDAQRWIGADITFMAIYAACAQSGVYKATVIAPTSDLLVGPDSAVVIDSAKLTYRGIAE